MRNILNRGIQFYITEIFQGTVMKMGYLVEELECYQNTKQTPTRASVFRIKSRSKGLWEEDVKIKSIRPERSFCENAKYLIHSTVSLRKWKHDQERLFENTVGSKAVDSYSENCKATSSSYFCHGRQYVNSRTWGVKNKETHTSGIILSAV